MADTADILGRFGRRRLALEELRENYGDPNAQALYLTRNQANEGVLAPGRFYLPGASGVGPSVDARMPRMGMVAPVPTVMQKRLAYELARAGVIPGSRSMVSGLDSILGRARRQMEPTVASAEAVSSQPSYEGAVEPETVNQLREIDPSLRGDITSSVIAETQRRLDALEQQLRSVGVLRPWQTVPQSLANAEMRRVIDEERARQQQRTETQSKLKDWDIMLTRANIDRERQDDLTKRYFELVEQYGVENAPKIKEILERAFGSAAENPLTPEEALQELEKLVPGKSVTDPLKEQASKIARTLYDQGVALSDKPNEPAPYDKILDLVLKGEQHKLVPLPKQRSREERIGEIVSTMVNTFKLPSDTVADLSANQWSAILQDIESVRRSKGAVTPHDMLEIYGKHAGFSERRIKKIASRVPATTAAPETVGAQASEITPEDVAKAVDYARQLVFNASKGIDVDWTELQKALDILERYDPQTLSEYARKVGR